MYAINTMKSAPVRWIVIVLGILVGAFRFITGWSTVFAIGSLDSWVRVAVIVALSFVLLPLTIVGIFRPRLAAYGLFLDSIVIFAGLGFANGPWTMVSSGLWSLLTFLIFYVAPPLGVGAVLFSSGSSVSRDDEAQTDSAQQELALRTTVRTSALVLGVATGCAYFWLGAHWLVKLAHESGWRLAAVLTAAFLALLPLSLFAIFRPQVASYLIFASILLTLAGGSYTLGMPASIEASRQFSFMLLPAIALPAIVAGLLLYSTAAQKNRT